MTQDNPHRLSELDEEAATAICSVCGPTRVRVRPGRNQCWTLRANEHKRFKKPRTALQARALWLKQSYGMSLQDFDDMVSAQDGRCAICCRLPDRLVVDHDHDTGRVRALLCDNCNKGIGMLGDDLVIVTKAMHYLSRHLPEPAAT